VKPIITSTFSTSTGKPKQTINNSSSKGIATNDISNSNGQQKMKFIAPRFERMHHAKQHASSSLTTTSSNRTQLRTNNNNNNNNQRNYIINPTRRR
jgi:hypothetical protein